MYVEKLRDFFLALNYIATGLNSDKNSVMQIRSTDGYRMSYTYSHIAYIINRKQFYNSCHVLKPFI